MGIEEPQGPRFNVTVRLNDAEEEGLKEIAKAKSDRVGVPVSLSAVARIAIRDYIKRERAAQ